MPKQSLRELLIYRRDHDQQVKKDWYLVCSQWCDQLGLNNLEEARIRAHEDLVRMHPKYFSNEDKLWMLIPSLFEIASGGAHHIERAMEFLEVDVLSFRMGYYKASMFNVLKTVPLTNTHKRRIQNLGLMHVNWAGQRREFRELSRLLILVADQRFLLELDKVAKASEDELTRRKAKILIYKILNSRVDLRGAVALPKSF